MYFGEGVSLVESKTNYTFNFPMNGGWEWKRYQVGSMGSNGK